MKRGEVVIAVLVLVALSNSGGITNYSGKQAGTMCNTCHAGGAAPTVEIAGPASLAAGASATYSVKITGGAGVLAGFNAAASGGQFIGGAGTRVTGGEVTHSMGKAFSAGSATFSFTYQAPPAAGAVTLYAAGMSASGSNGEMGDMAAMTTLDVTVTGGGTSVSQMPATAPEPEPMAAPRVPGLPGGVIEGGCSVAGGGPLLVLVVLALARRRRGMFRA